MENTFLAGKSKYGAKQYVQCIMGGVNARLILLAPHGGDLRPESILNRNEHPLCQAQGGPHKVAIVKDAYTKEIATMLREEIVDLTSHDFAPHLVICHLHRKKVDVNRPVKEATLDDNEATTAYNDYHGFISSAKDAIGTGLVVDLHGQTHPEQWVELGYTLSKNDLNCDQLQKESSSIRALCKRSELGLEDLIRGSNSLGCFLENEGIKTVPSPSNPKTAGNYFTGGYCTYAHGSKYNGSVDCIQIETPRKYRNKEDISDYVKCLAKALVKFVTLHYGTSETN